MDHYWDERFSSGGRIWGDDPSLTAVRAERIFREYDAKTILIPGAGYGRHADFFAASGYQVTGIEIAAEAIALARPHPAVRYLHGSVLDPSLYSGTYDAVYGFNILHLLRAPERAHFIGLLGRALRPGGVAILTVFSEEEPQYGRGRKVEENTFESKPGRPVHFFTEPDLRTSLGAFTVLETGLVDDPEHHGAEGPHTHRLRFICAEK
jgi:SAM-dependent methyltransferase